MNRALTLLSIAAATLLLPAQAGATPGAFHVAFGEGVANTRCEGLSPLLCSRTDSLQIDASDVRPLGDATYQCVSQFDFPCDDRFPGPSREITLSCVVIRDVSGGHELFASGTDQTGAEAYLFVRSVDTESPQFAVSSSAASGRCQAPTAPSAANVRAGIFTIEPAPSSPLEADLAVTETDSRDPVVQGDPLSYTVTVTNNGPEQATGVRMRDNLPVGVEFRSATPSKGNCSQSSGEVFCDIGILASGETATAGIDVTAREAGTITNGAAVTGNETDPDNANNTALESTEVETVGYPRPKGASTAVFSLVPAFAACASPNSSHGAPLNAPSCSPPALASRTLTVGTPDANGKVANFRGSLSVRVVGESPVDPSNGDQADVVVSAQVSDVRNKDDLSDYVGPLRAELTFRITDRYNGPNRVSSATSTDIALPIYFWCYQTDDPSTGSSCNFSTTLDAYFRGIVTEGQRSIWELAQAKVYDEHGVPSLFAVQGVFIP